jgi:uncharacterized membrane protein YozB (DUF420 family)
VIKTRNLKGWFSQNGIYLFPFLAFAIPLLVRAIPEILMGSFVTGFDTLGYYVPNTIGLLRNGVNFWAFIGDAPLAYLPLLAVTSLGGSIVVTIKVLAPLLLGFLGLSIYFYANKSLSWSRRKSLLVVLFATLYFVALRISWDMLRSEVGLIFLFVVLIFLDSKQSLRNGFLLALSMAAVVFANQLVAVVMFAIILATIARFYIDKKTIKLHRLVICSAFAACLFFVTLYIFTTVSNFTLVGSFANTALGEDMALLGFSSYKDLVMNTSSFLAFCYLPLIPLLIIGAKYFKSNIQLKAWIAWIGVSLLLVLLSPNASFAVYPYRWILLLTYPLAFFATDAFSHIKRKLYKIGLGLCMGVVLATLSFGFIALQNNDALSYYSAFPAYMPKSMLQNTVQLSDCQDTSNALEWTKNNMPSDGRLLVHDAFRGWASLTLNTNQLIPIVFYEPETIAQNITKTNSSTSLYLIWWVNGTGWYGESTVPATFNEIYRSGNIAIYHYEP